MVRCHCYMNVKEEYFKKSNDTFGKVCSNDGSNKIIMARNMNMKRNERTIVHNVDASKAFQVFEI